ncbi:MAG: septum site-determining protein MinC [Methylococcales bacterium]
MSTDSQQIPYFPSALEFKSSTFSVPVLILSVNDVSIIEHQLQEKIQLAPEFFKNSPLVIDLTELNKHELDIDIEVLTEIIYKLNLLPIGLRGGSQKQNQHALELGIPIHSSHTTTSAEPKKAKVAVSDPAPVADIVTTVLITQPVRSGQRVYASGDLIIMAQVSAGAEILAEGNIHVYSSLRGRALAGVQGNPNARIFCSDLQAELISIAGNYKVSEDLKDVVRNKPVQIYLQDHTLVIKDI